MQQRVITGICGVALALLVACASSPTAVLHGTGGPASVRLEVAATDAARTKGLMFRQTLAEGDGMLFVFGEAGDHGFWMKNTFIPLDFVWLSASGEVVDVRANVPPCLSDPCSSYASGKPARAVLEVNAGFAAAHGVRPGERLTFHNVPGFPVPGGGR
jgi:uncharacterized membrane protein (UPF0127 family)